MIEDFHDYNGSDRKFFCDLCIIGAGAAGITLARELRNSGLNILLLESGGRDYESDIQDLAAGQSEGYDYYDLRESRLRFFGGTTAIWGGRVAQLDEIDFKERPWIDHSGWPLTKGEVRPYYRQAQNTLGLPMVDDNQLPGYEDPFDHDVLQTAAWQFDQMFDRFTLRRCSDLVDSRTVRILLHATATGIETNDNGTIATQVRIANLNGGKAVIQVENVVLAAGGLEIPRLMLASRASGHPQGLGNNHDLVGRFFMEHPHTRAARIHVSDSKAFFKVLPRFQRQGDGRYGLLFRPAERWQEQQGILNSGFTIAVRKHPDEDQVAYKKLYNRLRHDLSPTRTGRTMWKLTKKISMAVQDYCGTALYRAKLKKETYGLYAVMRAEQAPNPESRIKLGKDRDALGMPKPILDWRLSSVDKTTVAGCMLALDTELRRLRLGRVESEKWLETGDVWNIDPLVSNHPIGGFHHMGTTRMASSPQSGVVDEHCRVHGLHNVYVAGSSVFSTSGWANPTLTILALVLRLADHIEQK